MTMDLVLRKSNNLFCLVKQLHFGKLQKFCTYIYFNAQELKIKAANSKNKNPKLKLKILDPGFGC